MEATSSHGGLGGLGAALDSQKFGADVIQKTIAHGAGAEKLAVNNANQQSGKNLAQAVNGVGGKLNITV